MKRFNLDESVTIRRQGHFDEHGFTLWNSLGDSPLEALYLRGYVLTDSVCIPETITTLHLCVVSGIVKTGVLAFFKFPNLLHFHIENLFKSDHDDDAALSKQLTVPIVSTKLQTLRLNVRGLAPGSFSGRLHACPDLRTLEFCDLNCMLVCRGGSRRQIGPLAGHYSEYQVQQASRMAIRARPDELLENFRYTTSLYLETSIYRAKRTNRRRETGLYRQFALKFVDDCPEDSKHCILYSQIHD